MAKISEIEKKKAAERRLALLALASTKPPPSDACPDAETLAALVEGKLNREKADACRTHLAGCESCYRQWQQLDRQWQEQAADKPTPSILRLFRRPHVLTATGSLLAAAASIAVFLTHTTQVDRSSLPRLPQTTVQEQPAPAMDKAVGTGASQALPAAPSSSAGRNDQAESAGKQPSTLPAEPVPSKQHKSAARSNQGEPEARDASRMAQPEIQNRLRERKEETAASAPQEDRAKQEKAREKDVAPRQDRLLSTPAAPQATISRSVPVDEAAALTLEGWHGRIRQGCQGPPRTDTFRALVVQGQQLLRESRALSPEERHQIERLLTLLDSPPPAGQQCPALLHILGLDPQLQKN